MYTTMSITRPIYVAIEGIVGSGKSSLCEALSLSGSSNIHVLPEPVDAFQTFKNHNPLKLAYENPKQNAAIAQIHIIQSSFTYYSKMLNLSYPTLSHLITERSMESPIVFIETNRTRKIHTDFVADYLREYWLERNQKVRTPDIVIYLNVKPEVCLQRVALRSREGEQYCDVDYLQQLHASYRLYLTDLVKRDSKKRVYFISNNSESSVNECAQTVISLLKKDMTPEMCHILE